MDGLTFTRRRPVLIFVVVQFLLLIWMSYQVTDPTTGRRVLVNVLFSLFSPIQRVLATSFNGVGTVFHNYVAVIGASKENEELRKQVSELTIRLQATSQEHQENDRLRQILGLRERLPFRLEAAEVIARDAKSMVSNTITINRGEASGVKVQIPVLTPGGVLGITTLVSTHTSKVQLITDPSSSIGAMLERGRVSGILAGAGGGLCILRFLPLTAEWKKDDGVITSGQDGIFPEGLPVGRVSRELHESEFYKSIEVIPYKTHSSLSEVVLLTQPVAPQDK
jgi:rod shape-determining protein MreC